MGVTRTIFLHNSPLPFVGWHPWYQVALEMLTSFFLAASGMQLNISVLVFKEIIVDGVLYRINFCRYKSRHIIDTDPLISPSPLISSSYIRIV